MLKRNRSEYLSKKDELTRAINCSVCGEIMCVAGYSIKGTCWKCTFNSSNRMESKMNEEKSEVSMVTNGKHRGRPKGSKNKPKFAIEGGKVVVTNATDKPKGKRGRPKGSKNKPKAVMPEMPNEA